MRRLAATVSLAVAVIVPAPASAAIRPDPSGCERTYTRAHFHTAARSTFDRAFPLERKKLTLAKIIRCQRRAASVPIVRKHRKLYRAAWAKRFWLEHYWARTPAWLKGVADKIASCESGGDPTAVSDSGAYRGKYQFDFGTWAEVGGSGDPAAAPELEQDVRFAILYLRAGAGRWPVCGQ